MPTSDADGTWQRPIALACPDHQPSWAISSVQQHLDPAKWFTCWHDSHRGALWTVCTSSSVAGVGWDDFATPGKARHHAWRTT